MRIFADKKLSSDSLLIANIVKRRVTESVAVYNEKEGSRRKEK